MEDCIQGSSRSPPSHRPQQHRKELDRAERTSACDGWGHGYYGYGCGSNLLVARSVHRRNLRMWVLLYRGDICCPRGSFFARGGPGGRENDFGCVLVRRTTSADCPHRVRCVRMKPLLLSLCRASSRAGSSLVFSTFSARSRVGHPRACIKGFESMPARVLVSPLMRHHLHSAHLPLDVEGHVAAHDALYLVLVVVVVDPSRAPPQHACGALRLLLLDVGAPRHPRTRPPCAYPGRLESTLAAGSWGARRRCHGL